VHGGRSPLWVQRALGGARGAEPPWVQRALGGAWGAEPPWVQMMPARVAVATACARVRQLSLVRTSWTTFLTVRSL